jgi:uncharacterized protein YggT (Ycf19 family)
MGLRTIAVTLLNLFIAAVEAILGLRFILKLFGANGGNNFVGWIYEMSDGLLDPFRGIFPTKVFDNQYVLEFNTLFAMLMYALLGLLVVWIIAALTGTADRAVTTKKRK